MNAAERIVEAYFRHILNIFTRTGVRGVGQVELDIVGVDPSKSPPVFFHIESSVSISSGFSKISNKPFDPEMRKQKSRAAQQKTTAGYFIEHKFFSPGVEATLKKVGCDLTHLKRTLVAWEFDEEAQQRLEERGIECLSMKKILQHLADHLAFETSDIDSEILRTLQLFVRAKPNMPEIKSVQRIRQEKKGKLKV